jgi:hypothetical protein
MEAGARPHPPRGPAIYSQSKKRGLRSGRASIARFLEIDHTMQVLDSALTEPLGRPLPRGRSPPGVRRVPWLNISLRSRLLRASPPRTGFSTLQAETNPCGRVGLWGALY